MPLPDGPAQPARLRASPTSPTRASAGAACSPPACSSRSSSPRAPVGARRHRRPVLQRGLAVGLHPQGRHRLRRRHPAHPGRGLRRLTRSAAGIRAERTEGPVRIGRAPLRCRWCRAALSRRSCGGTSAASPSSPRAWAWSTLPCSVSSDTSRAAVRLLLVQGLAELRFISSLGRPRGSRGFLASPDLAMVAPAPRLAGTVRTRSALQPRTARRRARGSSRVPATRLRVSPSCAGASSTRASGWGSRSGARRRPGPRGCARGRRRPCREPARATGPLAVVRDEDDRGRRDVRGRLDVGLDAAAARDEVGEVACAPPAGPPPCWVRRRAPSASPCRPASTTPCANDRRGPGPPWRSTPSADGVAASARAPTPRALGRPACASRAQSVTRCSVSIRAGHDLTAPRATTTVHAHTQGSEHAG